MDRRLIILVGLAIAVVGYGLPFVLAQPPTAPGPTAGTEPGAMVPADADLPPIPAPAPATGPAPGETHVPQPTAAGTEPQADPPPPPSESLPPTTGELPPPAGEAAAPEPSPMIPAPAPAPMPANPAPASPEPGQPVATPDAPTAPPPDSGSLPPVPAMPAPAGPPPGAAGAPVPEFEPTPAAPSDPAMERSRSPAPGPKGPGRGENPLPPASETPGQPGDIPAESADHEADPFVLPADRLPMGRQSVGLTVDVVGPKVLNINQEAALKVVVRNTGTSDAMGVVVRDQLPDGLTLVSSQPEAQRSDALLFWKLNTVPAGSERVINVRVKPVKVGPFDHAATVTMLAGSKSRTIVREPKLKVEQVATTGKVLKGQPVQFRITISNPGDGPARNVVVQAKLSPGLRVDYGETSSQNLFELPPFDIEPYQRVVLDTLEADTLQSGEQTCTVVAQSPDVTTSKDEARNVATVSVIEPKMRLAIGGDDKRFTDTIASYNVTVENPGSATAHNVRVLVTLPLSGRFVGPPQGGARWDPASGRLLWTIPQVDPGEKAKVALPFQVRLGNVGSYKVTVDARADGGLSDQTSFSTDVVGMADVEFEVHEQRRFVDVDDETSFQIRIRNIGTKEARRILVRAVLSKNIVPFETNNGTDDPTKALWNPEKQQLIFPEIDHLDHGKEIVMGIKVRAKEDGLGTCHVFLLHDELKETEALQDMAHLRITTSRR